MKTKPKNRAGKILLGIVASAYLLLFLLDPAAGGIAVSKAFGTFKTILFILPAVLFVMALLNTFIRPKRIAEHLGEQSGPRGWFIALAGGVVSHGPGYVWYPLLADLRVHGARNGLIVAFFYARAVKLPWLPMMISYFGLAFTLSLCFYIIVGAWLQGVAAEKLLKGTP